MEPEIYEIWMATSNNALVTLAISADTLIRQLDGGEMKAQDFFLPDAVDIQKRGEIEITGDTHLLGGFFDLTG